ncbi:hypothetical protein TRFO_32202 [Tritrichomonas foetus]|uniref:EF-hand domain-containing protein n=1 Tax=Tritrichomonas foetus TaxID=1144522 RepID=A0A1J4JQC3_9EUKA|nr:hypothetical protein TRFO_32202 [Tritrichomonas foetus]|eukprot:OHT00946.1 hypothetical protein TRFO_32202 [Tritrichomonas foetus]
MGQGESIDSLRVNAEISPEELEKLQKEFNEYDDNHNNLLERRELEAFLSNQMPELVRFSRVIMDLFGTGKKGTITFDNFKIFYLSLQKVGIDESDPMSLPMLIFSKLDKDNSYYISAKEIKHLWKLLRPKHSKKKVTLKEVEEVIKKQHPAREKWGLSRDEFIRLFDSFLTTAPTIAEEVPDSLPKIYGGGQNKMHQVGTIPKASVPDIIETATASNLKCICAGDSHTVIIDERCIVYGLGSNKLFQIGGPETEYPQPTIIMVHTKNLVWAAAGENFTVYLDEEGKILYCGQICKSVSDNEVKPIIINPEKQSQYVYLAASTTRFAAIDTLGRISIFTSDPRQQPSRCTLPKPAYDVACGCTNFTNKFFAIAITVDGQLYGYEALNKELHHFAPIPQLNNIPVLKVFGYSHHAAVLTTDGRVMMYGCGNCGQCGNGHKGNNDVFKQVKGNLNSVFVDCAVGEEHSLFLNKEGQIFSCGNNQFFQLMIGKTKDVVLNLTPTPLIKGKAVSVACGSNHSLTLVDAKKIKHPGMTAFGLNQ